MRHWQGRRCCFLAYCRGRSHRGAASVAAAVSCPRPLLSMGQLGADAADRSRADGWQAVVAPSTPTGLWHALMGGAQHGFFCPAAAVAVAFTATESAAAASAAAAMAAATTAAAVAPTAATVGWSTDVAATCFLRPRPFYYFFAVSALLSYPPPRPVAMGLVQALSGCVHPPLRGVRPCFIVAVVRRGAPAGRPASVDAAQFPPAAATWTRRREVVAASLATLPPREAGAAACVLPSWGPPGARSSLEAGGGCVPRP